MDVSKLKKQLDEAQEILNIPSYSVTLYKDGEITNLSSGYYNLEEKVAASSDTLYAIGSCTKAFVAGTICTLIDKGLLSLEDTVKQHIPEFGMYDSYVTNHLTIRDMLCHRCGLPRHEFSWYFRMNSITKNELIDMVRYLKPNQPFRYKWQYSNHMYALAGVLIEKLTGEKWQDVMKKSILEPLGIKRLAFSGAEAQKMNGCAVPYVYDKENKQANVIPHAVLSNAFGTAGSLYLTTEGLAKWEYMLLNQGEYNGKKIISKELCKEMATPQMIQNISTKKPEPIKCEISSNSYGLGLMTESYKGHRIVYHGGHINGFMAEQFFLPDDSFACAILTNLGQDSAALVMRYIILQNVIGGDKEYAKEFLKHFVNEENKIKEVMSKIGVDKPGNAPCPVELEAICGKFLNKGYGELEVGLTEDNKDLLIKFHGVVLVTEHYANQYFYAKATALAPDYKIECQIDVDIKGEVQSFDIALEPESKEKISFKRIIE